jgi:hypothetical protein
VSLIIAAIPLIRDANHVASRIIININQTLIRSDSDQADPSLALITQLINQAAAASRLINMARL